MSKRERRSHSEEFKREAVRLVVEQGQSVARTARDLGIHENLLRTWKRKYTDGPDESLSESDQMELSRLREENRRLRMERDILKKATAFFANEKN